MKFTGGAFLLRLIVLLSMPHFVLGALFTPIIKNHGTYKDVGLGGQQYLTPLVGHVPMEVNNSYQWAPVDGDEIFDLSIVMPLRQEWRLDMWLLDVTNPKSPNYQKYLTHGQFVDQYAPTEDEIDWTINYFESRGIEIRSVAKNRMILSARGAVANINAVFNTEIHHYFTIDGDRFYAPAYELQVDDSINILGVLGLENRTQARPNFKILEDKSPQKNKPQAGPTRGYIPSQITTAYSVPSGLTGSGQTLAVFELDAFTMSDIIGYEQAFNLPNVPIKVVTVDGGPGAPGGGAVEVTLDIQLMIALAPGAAQIIVYEGPNSGQGLVDTYNKIATDNLASAISTSWGMLESSSIGSITNSENQIFKQMAAQGQSIYSAAGDSGAYQNGTSLSVQDPSTQPFMVSVGGTTLTLNSDNSYKSEKTWSSGNGPGHSGGGGGISGIWPIPTWQQGVITPASLGSTTMRNTPDVSLDSDPRTGYAIYFGGSWTVVGGTSCAAPLWAAFTGLVNQQRASNGQGLLGFANPVIYQLAQTSNYGPSFHDIADGSTNGHYPAVTGYDLATGWGTFIASGLIPNLAGGGVTPPSCTQANPTVSISPATQSGAAGASLSYTVSVTSNDSSACSASTFNLTATNPSGFTSSLGQNSLTIQPGQSATTTIAVTSASNATAGSYNFSVNAVNSQSSSFSGTGSAAYVVQTSQPPQVTLTINPQNATFPYDSNTYAKFTFTLANGQTGIANNPIKMTVKGPSFSWSQSFTTGSNGTVQYLLMLNNGIVKGQYQMTLTSSYQGNNISAQTNFIVQ